MAELYHINAVETYHKAFLKLEASTRQICNFIPTGPSRSEAPTVHVIGLDCLGQHYNTCVDDVVKRMQSNATEHPVNNATLVILHNTTDHGTPTTPSPDLRKAIQNCRKTVT